MSPALPVGLNLGLLPFTWATVSPITIDYLWSKLSWLLASQLRKDFANHRTCTIARQE